MPDELPADLNPSWGECDRPDCEHACPEDKVAILLDEAVYCSPDCARAALDDAETPPKRVELHDPELNANRGALPVSDESTSIWRHVSDEDHARETVDALDDIYPLLFRVEDPEAS